MLALAGCSINPPVDLGEMTTGVTAPVVLDVPFFPQTDFQCGPAALAGLLGASGLAADPEALSRRLYLPKRRGSLQVELLSATRSVGRIAYVIEDELKKVVDQVLEGRPVLVLQNLRTPHFPVWHYSVVVGLDPDRNTIVLNTGTREHERVGAGSFLRTWDWAGRWAMLALAPGDIPASADAVAYAAAVSDFEATAGAEAALPAWRAAIERWPDDARWFLALGNQAYERGELAAAAAHYRDGLRLDPGHPVLSNNLAMTLGELGCARAAEGVLDRALETPGRASPWAEAIADTRGTLTTQRENDPVGCAEFQL